MTLPPAGASVDDTAALVRRIQCEFLEMPGLRLTPVQAARLWSLDSVTSERILRRLAQAGFLLRTRQGAYLRPPVA